MTETKKKKIKFINCTKITDYFYTQAGIFKKKKKMKHSIEYIMPHATRM